MHVPPATLKRKTFEDRHRAYHPREPVDDLHG